MKRFIPLAIAVAAIFGPILFVHSCANTTQAPTGGLKDTIPPLIIDIKPFPGATNVPVSGAKIVFTFDEYVTIKNAKNIFLSPPQSKPVTAKLHGRSVVVTFEEDLDPNTTYTISFLDAVADNNEGNMFPGYTYVFSTGEKIDSMMVTGTVQDCNTLKVVKNATVLLYKDLSDSAVFLQRPYAASKTDDWGFFVIPYIADTVYRLYAIKDEVGNNIYDPESDLVAFVDSVIRPTMVAHDTVREMLKYDMTDTLSCLARHSEYELNLFREKPTKQFLKNHARTGTHSGYISFQASNAWIDSLWFRGFKADQVISQFNILHDSLELWVNSTKVPDTLHLFVNYRKTDTSGVMKPELEHLKLFEEGVGAKKKVKKSDLSHDDTVCVYKLTAMPETVEQNGFELEFSLPVVNAKFDSLRFRYLNPKQKEFTAKVKVERDSTNLRKYIIRPDVEYLKGYEYFLKVPAGTFRDIRGFWCDSTEVKVMLPNDDKLSSLTAVMTGVDRKIIVDLMDQKKNGVLRSYTIDSDRELAFPYLKDGSYYIRITDDGNRNSFVDTGSLLEHRQPEKVLFVKFGDEDFIEIPASSEVEHTIDVKTLFGK